MTPTRRHSLDFVRGLAALGVLIYHSLVWLYGIEIESLGTFSVYLFFVLSGLTMMMVHGPEFAQSITPEAVALFYRKRIARIFPLLVAVAMATFAMGLVHGRHLLADAARAFLTATGLFAAHAPALVSVGTGTWTLAIEFAFYLLFPTIALLSMPATRRALLAVLIFLLLGQQIELYLLRPFDGDELWHFYTLPLTFAPFFAIGILIYRLGDRPMPGALPLALATMLALLLVSLATPAELFKAQGLYFGMTVLAGVTIAFAYRARVSARLRPLASLLGDISYALYLTHPLTFQVVSYVCGKLHIGPEHRLLPFVGSSIVVAWLSYHTFEAPLRRAIVSGRSRPREDRPAPLASDTPRRG